MKTFWFQETRIRETYTVEFVETKQVTALQSFFFAGKCNSWNIFLQASVIVGALNDYTSQERKKYWTTVTCFVSTNSTVYVSGVRFSRNQLFFVKSCLKLPKVFIITLFYNAEIWKVLSDWEASEVQFGKKKRTFTHSLMRKNLRTIWDI